MNVIKNKVKKYNFKIKIKLFLGIQLRDINTLSS